MSLVVRSLSLLGVMFCGLVLAGCANDGGRTGQMTLSAAERAQAQVNLARGYLAEGDPSRARPAIRRALELDAGLVEAHVLAAVMYEREREAALAERHFTTALQLEPANPQVLNNYGAFLYGQGRLSEALGPLRLAARDTNYRLRAQAFENLGLTELALGRLDAAESAFQRALALGGDRPRSSLELAAMLYARQDYSAAEHHYHRYLAQAGVTPRSLCLGLRLGGAPGTSTRSTAHADHLRNQYPEATSACP